MCPTRRTEPSCPQGAARGYSSEACWQHQGRHPRQIQSCAPTCAYRAPDSSWSWLTPRGRSTFRKPSTARSCFEILLQILAWFKIKKLKIKKCKNVKIKS